VAEIPQRVVSMNLCTDQLAMMLAAPGQLLSVSHLASDPRGSAMADEAKSYPPNRGLAEEIYLMQPDLVLAGSFTSRATVAMLQRLGVRVEIFGPAYGLDEIPGQMLRMGEVLGQDAKATAMVARYKTDLAAFHEEIRRNPRAAIYAANGYTQGDQSLSGQILLAAGFTNVAAEAGYGDGGIMPLEQLVMLAPEAVITSRPYPGDSRAEEVMTHPALIATQDEQARGTFSDRDWVCGTPFVLRAVADMADLRRALTGPGGD
jgi:iron complex transport system substrate-binding protein